MSKKRFDLTGKKFGRLLVLCESLEDANDRHGIPWKCQCDCGAIVVVYTGALRSGGTKSCGCLRRQLAARLSFVHGHLTGGQSRMYACWSDMLRRCENPKDKRYHLYGGRGIRVCPRWKQLKYFIEDMGQKPRGLTLERIDNDGDYCPKNCCWATQIAQCLNRRARNAVGRVGVYWVKRQRKWRASIEINGKVKHCGTYGRLEDAMAARMAAEMEVLKEYHPALYKFRKLKDQKPCLGQRSFRL